MQRFIATCGIALMRLERFPGRADRFRRASLKGWEYALAHPDEMIRLIMREYRSTLGLDHLRFEAAETRKLILPESIPLGYIDAGRLRRLAAMYADHKLAPPLSEKQLQNFVFANRRSLALTPAEQEWLKAHPVIRVGIDRDFAPYEWFDEKGRFVGINADILRLLETRLKVRFDVVKGKTWQQTLDMARNGELDMLADAVAQTTVGPLADFTMDDRDRYELKIAGLLHDFGKVVFAQFMPQELKKALEISQTNGSSLHLALREVVGTDHAVVGAMLVEKWRFSADLVETVRCQYSPELNDTPMIACVFAANQISKKLQFGSGGNPWVEEFTPTIAKRLGGTLDEIIVSLGDLAPTFEEAKIFSKI